jgi:hypothetical protein
MPRGIVFEARGFGNIMRHVLRLRVWSNRSELTRPQAEKALNLLKGTISELTGLSEILQKQLVIGPQPVAEAGEASSNKIPLPEMIDDPRFPFKVMKGVATAGQFAALVRAGYEIMGDASEILKGIIADASRTGSGTGHVSLQDGRALAKELNRQNPGRKFRILTEQEVIKMEQLIGNQLSYMKYSIWTETKWTGTKHIRRDYILLDLSHKRNRSHCREYLRYPQNAVCLGEDR